MQNGPLTPFSPIARKILTSQSQSDAFMSVCATGFQKMINMQQT